MKRRIPEPPKFMATCQMCGGTFQFGPNIYNGKFISAYKMMVCKTCFESNWDGWGPLFESRLISHLTDNAIPLPNRNKEGFFPRGA